MRRILLVILASITLGQTLHAQIQVDLNIPRRLFMMYEPVIATITVTNRSGRDLPLCDADGQPWFGFEIVRGDGAPVGPTDPDYHLTPLTIPAGGIVKRTVDVNALYPVHEFGMYRIRALVYFAPLQKYFQSQLSNIEISEGKVIWQQSVGVPDGEKNAGSMRKLSLLTFRHSDNSSLYVRVEDTDHGTVLGTVPLGRLIGADPEIQLDIFNHLHVLQTSGGKSYVYSRIGLNGEPIQQKFYTSPEQRPILHKDKVGEVTVIGGQLTGPNAPKVDDGISPAPGAAVPKLSDRPPGLPTE